MKHFLLVISLFYITEAYSQNLVFNEIGFSLKAEDKEMIEKLAKYEVKIFNGLFINSLNDSLRINVNLYGKNKDFRAVLAEGKMKGFTESGFYSSFTKQLHVLYLEKRDIETILHEISHALMHHNLQRCPRWFNEGLAEFLESIEIGDNLNPQVYMQHHHIKYVREANQNQELDIYSLLMSGNEPWTHKNNLNYLYATSYGVIYYIIKKDPHLIGKMAMMMKQGKSIQYIFEVLFGGIDKFASGFKFYYR
ncbi:DUF1570 domain-containing protein [Pseudopedobacter sp.]|uniref:DUF1570 domain-containing protein n=1 Tax=Pseudopedobacter sp. TaxID=1936787 RepID=UPI0033422A3E